MYCVGCFNRASQQPPSSWNLHIWTPLSLYAQEVSASASLQQLVDGNALMTYDIFCVRV